MPESVRRGALLALLALTCSGAWAGWREDLGAARVVGEGDVRWWGVRLYHARLWSGQAAFDADRPFALELTYHRAIGRDRIVAVSIDEIRRIHDAAVVPEQLQAWRQRLQRALIDVRPGDRLIGAYHPGQGLRFYFAAGADEGDAEEAKAPRGEQLLAAIDDDALARAFFAIWLDRRTSDPATRARLLGLPQDERP